MTQVQFSHSDRWVDFVDLVLVWSEGFCSGFSLHKKRTSPNSNLIRIGDPAKAEVDSHLNIAIYFTGIYKT